MVLRGAVSRSRLAGEVQEGPGRPRKRAAGAWPRRTAAGVPERLPAPRCPAVHRARGRGEAQPALPVSLLDLRAGRQADGRAQYRVADRRDRCADRPLSIRSRARRADRMARLRLGVPVRHPAAVRRRDRRDDQDTRRFRRHQPLRHRRSGRRPSRRLRRGGQLEADRRELHGVLPLLLDPSRARRSAARVRRRGWPRSPTSASVPNSVRRSPVSPWTAPRASTVCPGITEEQDRRYYAITVKPTVFINLVPDHIIFHRMYPMSPIADRRRMRLALHRRCGVAPVATSRTPSSCSTGSTSRTSRRASELSPRCRPAPTARAVCSYLPNITSRSSTSG